MFRSVVTFIAASFLALSTAGCPSRDAVVQDPVGTKIEEGKAPTIRQQLAANRARHIEELRAYREAGVFPKNEVMPRVANIFRDGDGHLCAVANMIQKDGGNDDLIDRTVKTNNLIRLADVKSGELYDWIVTSGFTQEEIAMIQAPYMPPQQVSFDEERTRLQERLKDAEERLRDDTEQSLDVALQRYVQYRDSGSVRWASM